MTTYSAVEPAIPTPEPANTGDRRVAKRAQLKEELAAAHLAVIQHAELQSAIDERASKKDRLASSHVESARPLQSRLKEIERLQIDAIKDRQPADAELEAERVALLAQLREMNSALEAAIQQEDADLNALERERRAVAAKACPSLVETELIKWSPEELRVTLHVVQRSHNMACERRKAILERIAKIKHEATFDRDPTQYIPPSGRPFVNLSEFACKVHAAELSAAEAEVSRTKIALDAALRACIEE